MLFGNFIFPLNIKITVGYKEALMIISSISETVIRLINNFIIEGNFAFLFRSFIRREFCFSPFLKRLI